MTIVAIRRIGADSTISEIPVEVAGLSTIPESTTVTLTVSNEHTRRTGRALGDGLYPYKYLVQNQAITRLSLSKPGTATWTIDGSLFSETPSHSIEYIFTTIGEHTVEADDGQHIFKYSIDSKTVRYEIRDLSTQSRQKYFDALQTMYTVGQEEGEATFGSSYMSSDYLVRLHLKGAADPECDHWHDDAGIMNHHIGITWLMEKSLQLIEPSTAAHYWDYTRDSEDKWTHANVFNDEWFGSNSPADESHAINKGRFAYTKVMTDARDFSDITNPYGLMRSPWNTNPIPYVMRSNRTMGAFGDNQHAYPSCTDFASSLNNSLASILKDLNGKLHGPIHIMLGGHWDFLHDWTSVTENNDFPDQFLLLSKTMWRQGFVRMPSLCSADTPHAECMPSCPSEIRAGRTAKEILNNITFINAFVPDLHFESLLKAHGFGYGEFLDELCHVGSPGEMFTSAAPQDPLFWPLHGNAERFQHYARHLHHEGKISMDQTWGYAHQAHNPSDTGLVCDWSNTTGLGMPSCERKTCDGHKEDDLLPFASLYDDQTSLVTNGQFYGMTNPENVHMPYVYDSLDYWEACTNSSMWNEWEVYVQGEEMLADDAS